MHHTKIFEETNAMNQEAPLLLVEGRKDNSDEGPSRYSSPVSGDSKCHIFTFSYLLLGNEHIMGVSLFHVVTNFPSKKI